MQKNKNLKEIHIAKKKGGEVYYQIIFAGGGGEGGGGNSYQNVSFAKKEEIVMKIIYVVGDILMLICQKSSKKNTLANNFTLQRPVPLIRLILEDIIHYSFQNIHAKLICPLINKYINNRLIYSF